MSKDSLLKRLEALAKLLSVAASRSIVILVDGNLPRDNEAEIKFLDSLFLQPHDNIVLVKQYAVVEDLPRIASVSLNS